MKRRLNGMILLTTLLMISMISVWVLSLMQSVLLYIKATEGVVRHQESLYQLERATEAVFHREHPIACSVSLLDPNQVIDRLLEGFGCIFKHADHSYEYLIDDLGPIPCIVMEGGQGMVTSHHWLVTVLTTTPHRDLLQIRWAEPGKTMACESQEPQLIRRGILTWRYLPDF